MTDDEKINLPDPREGLGKYLKEMPAAARTASEELFTAEAVQLAVALYTWCATSDRSGLESPNYALGAASAWTLMQVDSLLGFRMGAASASIGNGTQAGLDRRLASEALGWVQNEILHRMDPLRDEPF